MDLQDPAAPAPPRPPALCCSPGRKPQLAPWLLCAVLAAFGAAGVRAEGLDTVQLRDGSTLRGNIQENRPGDSLTLRLLSGRVRTIRYSDIQSVSGVAPEPAAAASPAKTAPPEAPAPPAAPAPGPALARGSLPPPLPESLSADPMADLEVLDALQAALKADAAGKADPARAAAAWHDLEKRAGVNPYERPAAERAAQWDGYAQNLKTRDTAKGGAREKVLQALRSPTLGAELKKQLVGRYASDYGEPAAVELLAGIPPSPVRAELCGALTKGAAQVQFETNPSGLVASVYLDDRLLGPAGTYPVPACSLSARITDQLGHSQETSLADGIPPKIVGRFSDWDVKPAMATNLRSNLVWLRVGPADPRDFLEAGKYCAGLPHDGAKEWRLPTKDELTTLVVSKARPAIDPKLFPNTPGKPFWTGSEDSRLHMAAIDFRFGSAMSLHVNEKAQVRCVHER